MKKVFFIIAFICFASCTKRGTEVKCIVYVQTYLGNNLYSSLNVDTVYFANNTLAQDYAATFPKFDSTMRKEYCQCNVQ
jgi:hypothetical protein